MNKVSLLGVPMDLGQTRRGVDMGPSAIRYAGVTERLERLGYTVKDYGNVTVDNRTIEEDTHENLKNLIAVVQTSRRIRDAVKTMLEDESVPLLLGGDHSMSIGTLAAITTHYENIGVIWYDAHGDLNVPKTSPTGNIHGMPLAVNLGFGHEMLTEIGARKLKPENVVLMGARDLDEGERAFIKEHNMLVFTMHEVDMLGMATVMHKTLEHLQHTDGIHLSLDLDALDPMYCPGVGTPVLGGVTYRESHLAMEMLAASKRIVSAEFVEVNPILDERNKTAEVAVALIASLFGDTLL
ncbi:MAG: arginase [Caryophanon sp.]|nr:arginase [Caryophanon sp.]